MASDRTLAAWQARLAHLEEELVVAADPDQKLKLRQRINAVRERIAELKLEEEREVPSAVVEDLDRAYSRKVELDERGEDSTIIREEIRALLRQLRIVPRLKAGMDLLDGRFELQGPIGEGGFARVWKAYDRMTRTVEAIKVLHDQFTENRTRRERFFHGARQMAKLEHPGILKVIEAQCEDQGRHFFVTELVRGGDLRTAVLEGRLSPISRMLKILDVGEALSFAHEHGVIHRDVRPDNVLFDTEGRPRLIDFDLVQVQDTSGGTRTGILDRVLFAAPEAMHSATRADVRADVYGLGMTAIFALHGADLPLDMIRDVPRFVEELEVEPPVRKVLSRAVAWEPEKRQESMEAFCYELRESLFATTKAAARAQEKSSSGATAIPKHVSQPDEEPPGRQLSAWLEDDDRPLTIGLPCRVGFRIGPPSAAPIASADFQEPDWAGREYLDLLVMLWAEGATVTPNAHTVTLHSSGPTEPCFFEVTPFERRLALRFVIFLKNEGTFLQDLRADVEAASEPEPLRPSPEADGPSFGAMY